MRGRTLVSPLALRPTSLITYNPSPITITHRPLPAEPLLRPSQQLTRRHGLEHHLGAAELGAAFGDGGVVVAGESDGNAWRAILAAQLLEDVEPVPVGKR